MKHIPLDISDILMLVPDRWQDARGWFSETYNRSEWQRLGIAADFIQDNHSLSIQKGTLRGLHFQRPPHAQAKLIRVVQGSIFDVAVDLRPGSASFGKFVTAVLKAESGEQLFIPQGFAHGFCTLQNNTEVIYKVDQAYEPAAEEGVAWNDADIAIDWPVDKESVVISDKDAKLPFLRDLTFM